MIPIGKLFDIEKGDLQSTKCTPGEYDFITAAEEWKTHHEYSHECEALIFAAAASGSLGRTHYVDGKFTTSDLCYILTPKNEEKYPLNLSFYHFVFNSLRPTLVAATKSGTSKESINQTNFKSYEIPYFNIELQDLWIEKLKNTLGMKDLLAGELNHQQALLKKLRQQILQEAIEGKLAADWRAQNSDVEPASELLKRIATEKHELLRKKILKKGGATSKSITYREVAIPRTWDWCKADDIFFVTKLAGFEYTKHIKLKDVGEVPVIRAQNVRPFKIRKEQLMFIDRKTSELLSRCALVKPSLLVTFIGAGIGDVALFEELTRWHLAPNVAKLEPFENCDAFLSLRYLNIFLQSETGNKEIFKHVKATAQPSLSMGTIRDIDFPIPPHSEQQAIVAKVEKLLGLCDQLETHITQNQTHAEQLMQAVLKEAFSHNSATEPSATPRATAHTPEGADA
jgi:type I restriction enzyme S subunit